MAFATSFPPDKQPGFSCSRNYGVYKGNELVEEFKGDHYSIVFAAPESWLSVHRALQVEIAGRAFWIPPEALDKFRGKTLTLIQRDVGRGRYAGTIRDFLVVA
jgi:hypothetical protein